MVFEECVDDDAREWIRGMDEMTLWANRPLIAALSYAITMIRFPDQNDHPGYIWDRIPEIGIDLED
jgi:hypothetical protein